MTTKASPVTVSGPLACYAQGFGGELARLGYTALSAGKQLHLMAHLSRWLWGGGVGVFLGKGPGPGPVPSRSCGLPAMDPPQDAGRSGTGRTGSCRAGGLGEQGATV